MALKPALVLFLSAFNLLDVAAAGPVLSALHEHKYVTRNTNSTANNTMLKTWWHATGEINTQTPVQNGNVRQSHLYTVQVATGTPTSKNLAYYDSFVFETIPRNGNGKICTPGDPTSICDTDDQITIEPYIGITMAWTQFLYGSDVIVKVSRPTAPITSVANVVIRPSNLGYAIEVAGGAAFITVPHIATGVRFSVEFQDDLWTYRNAGASENSYYVQNVTSNGPGYVSSYDDTMPIVGVEPTNALLIFASPFPTKDLIPNDDADTLYVPTGLVTDLSRVTQSIVYFRPGVYYFTGTNHALLSSSVRWVYLAPGAYVKGAIEYQSNAANLKATGFGVLSGEQYVYQANTAAGYTNLKSDSTSLHMWRGDTTANSMTWTVRGVTLNSQPFNSMDFYGNLEGFSVDAADYKQVGAFFGQTDGMEMYPNSHVRDIFYHAGNDTIKTYYSNVLAERITVWKTNNAPIVQFGWHQRNLTNVTVDILYSPTYSDESIASESVTCMILYDSINVIHCRYSSQSTDYPRALVASASSYLNVDSTSDADINSHVSDFTISNWRSIGLSPALLGINPLQNIDTFTIRNVWIEELGPHTTQIDMSTFRPFTDANNHNVPIQLGANSPNNIGLTIKNYQVGSTTISFAAKNWDSFSLGRLNIDGAFEGRWTVG